MQTRELAENHGLKLEIINSVLLNSTHVDREPHPAIMLAQSPQRDRDIEAFQTLIQNCAAAGIPTLKYNMSILGVVRSGTVCRAEGTRSTYVGTTMRPRRPASLDPPGPAW